VRQRPVRQIKKDQRWRQPTGATLGWRSNKVWSRPVKQGVKLAKATVAVSGLTVGQPGERCPHTGAATHRERPSEFPTYVLFGFSRAQRSLALKVGVGIADHIIRRLLDLRIYARYALTGYAAYCHGDLRLRFGPYTDLYQ